MKAQDWAKQDGYRKEITDKLIAFCDVLGVDYTFGTKNFTIKLPDVNTDLRPKAEDKKRKSFDISKWGPQGPDELPPAEYTLDEGKPPEGDDEK